MKEGSSSEKNQNPFTSQLFWPFLLHFSSILSLFPFYRSLLFLLPFQTKKNESKKSGYLALCLKF